MAFRMALAVFPSSIVPALLMVFLGTFEHFLGTFGNMGERKGQGGPFDVADEFFDYRVFVAGCRPGGDDSAHSASSTLSYVEH